MLAKRHWRQVFGLGAVIALAVMGALGTSLLWLGQDAKQATTVAFLTLAMAQLWHVFTMRNRASGWVRNEITRNPWVWAALALCMALIVAAVAWPPLARVLSIADPGPAGWAVAVGASLVPLLIGQLTLLPCWGRARRTGA
jgi:Ca2+-transporting ATPase